MNIREKFEDFVAGYSIGDEESAVRVEETWDFIEGLVKEFEEEIFRIRYMEHDPKADCPCDICKTCERLFKFLR